MAAERSFRFGIEIELLLAVKKKTYQSWKALAKDVSKRLLRAGIPSHVNESNDNSHEDYREWSIVQEVTIPSQPGKNIWGIELVSPIYLVHSSWAVDIDAIFATLRSGGLVPRPSPYCSTHIHFSGTPTPLSQSELTALARAALIHENALDALVPAPRHGSSSPYWCQSNRNSPALRGLSLVAALSVVDRAGDIADSASSSWPIVEAMNLFPAASGYGRAHSKTKDFVRGKVYKWNFEGILSGNRQTVEFRLPPGCTDAEDARGWVELAMAFVAGVAAGECNSWAGGEEGAGLDDLWLLLMAGAATLGWEDVSGIEGVFATRQ